jgi:hypothetical protein
VFGPLFKRLRLGDNDVTARSVPSWPQPMSAVLAEQERLDGASGPAAKRWGALLPELTSKSDRGGGASCARRTDAASWTLLPPRPPRASNL